MSSGDNSIRSNKEYALKYAEMGWPVFPVYEPNDDGGCSCGDSDCNSPAKHPRISGGRNQATTDVALIDDWWERWSNANIGIVTGQESGIWTFDIDDRHGGYESLRELTNDFGELPESLRSETGGGGEHRLYIDTQGNIRSRANIRPGLDVRGRGGYIVAPPSVHISGNSYRWNIDIFSDELQLITAPDWLTDLVTRNQQSSTSDCSATGKIPSGSRNTKLTSIAGSLRRQGLDVDGIFAALRGINTIQCDPPLAEQEVRSIAESISKHSNKRSPVDDQILEWGPIKELPKFLNRALSLTEKMIPKPLREWIIDTCERLQVPLDYVAMGVIVALSSVIGRQVGIRPKQNDNFTVIPNLWGGLIAPPSTLKSPAITQALLPLSRLIGDADKEYEKSVAKAEIEQLGIEADIKKIEKSLGKLDPFKKESALIELGDLKQRLQEITPKHRRYFTSDATIEKLAEMLRDSPNGLLVHRDELTGFLADLEKKGREQDRSFYLEAWNGDQRHNVDRIGRGSISVPALCLTVLGGIQPSRFQKYIVETTENLAGNDGFVQRFQILVYPETKREWINIDRKPNLIAQNKGIKLFQKLSSIDWIDLGAEMGTHDSIPYLRLHRNAQPLYNEWIENLERRLRSQSIQPEALECHLGKYRSLMPSLALIFHLLTFAEHDFLTGPIPKRCVELAIKWCEYLESHAMKIYGLVEMSRLDSAKALMAKIKSGQVYDGMRLRDIYRKHWSLLKTPREVEQAISVLVECGMVQVQELSTEGRPSEVLRIHPELQIDTKNQDDKSDETHSDVSFGTFVTAAFEGANDGV